MSLIKCKECENEISDEAKICPKCGAKTEKAKQQRKFIKILAISILIIGIVTAVFITMEINNPIYQYSREAIKILEDYKENKISAEKASKELDSISYKAREKSEETENEKNTKSSTWGHMSALTGLISLEIELGKVDNVDINEYIKELKQF